MATKCYYCEEPCGHKRGCPLHYEEKTMVESIAVFGWGVEDAEYPQHKRPVFPMEPTYMLGWNKIRRNE